MSFRAVVAAFGCAPLVAGAATPDWHRGVDLVWFSPTVDQRVLDMTLDHMVAMGVDHVATNVWWFQNNINSTQVAPNFSLYSSTDDTLRQVIDAAHARGLSVELRPLVDLSNDPTHWRGDITGGSTWFNGAGGYGDYIRHMADIAQEKSVEMFSVGVELETAASQEANWRSLISSVRSRYSGPLAYAANWGNPAVGATINWWDAVDYLGIDAYYPLTNKNDPTPAELQAAWATRADQIETYRNSVAPGKTVLFTECGYINQDGTNRTPWTTPPGTANDQREQADAYEALLSQNLPRSWFGGAYWWAWDLNPNPNAIGFETMGKLAYDAMGAYYKPGYTIGPKWTGAAGGTFTNAANWSSAAAPGAMTTATFDGAGNGNTAIQLGAPVTLMRLIFDGAATAAYTFQSGPTLTFNAGGGITMTNAVATTQTVNCNVALDGPTLFANGSTVGGKLIINGTILGAGSGRKQLALIGFGDGTLAGSIIDGLGTVALFKGGASTWTITGASSFTGATDILSGTIVITNNQALGSGTGSTTVANGASLVLNPGLNVPNEKLQLAGVGVNGQGALQRADLGPYGAVTWGGEIEVAGSVAEIHNRAYNPPGGTNVLTLAGRLTGGSPGSMLRLRCGNSNPGFIRLTGAGSDYLGVTQIAGGKVILAAGNNTLPVTTVVEMDTYGWPNTVEAGVLDLNGTSQAIAGLTNIARATPSRIVNRLAGTGSTLQIDSSSGFSFDGSLQDGGGTLSLVKTGPGTQTLSGPGSFTGGTTVAGGTLMLTHPSAIAAGPLSVTHGAAVFAAGLSQAPKLRGVGVNSPGSIDLTSNPLIVDYTGASPLPQTIALIADGRIGSSKRDSATAIGILDNAAFGFAAFGGTPVDSTCLLMKLTWEGDANLDGQVDIADLSALATSWQTSGVWTTGDFDYSGFVDISDLALLASNWQAGVSVPGLTLEQAMRDVGLGGIAVPEPGAVFGAFCLVGVMGRRRRHGCGICRRRVCSLAE